MDCKRSMQLDWKKAVSQIPSPHFSPPPVRAEDVFYPLLSYFPPTPARCSPRRAKSRHSLQLPRMGNLLLLPTTGHVLLLFTLCWLQSFLELFFSHFTALRKKTHTQPKTRRKKPGQISSVLISKSSSKSI